MRKLLLFAALIIGIQISTFSQSLSPLQTDTSSVKFGFNNSTKSLGHFDSIDFMHFSNNSPNHKYHLEPKFADKGVHIDHLYNGLIKVPRSIDNMPCKNPQGSFQMPVYKPDSTINYTLLIKK